jgi:ferritin
MLNAQVGRELAASQQYLAAAIYFADKGLDKWADVFYRQSEEERFHALKIVKFLVEVGAETTVPEAPAASPTMFESPLDVTSKALAWEREVTQNFRDMAKAAMEEPDPVCRPILDWFLTEQVEEESTMDKLTQILESGLNPFMAEQVLDEATAEVGGGDEA